MTEQRMPLPADTVETAQTKTQVNCITPETICQIASLCGEVSMRTKADAFFSYSPHIPSMDVRIYTDGWETGTEWDDEFTIYEGSFKALRRATAVLRGYLAGEVTDCAG